MSDDSYKWSGVLGAVIFMAVGAAAVYFLQAQRHDTELQSIKAALERLEARSVRIEGRLQDREDAIANTFARVYEQAGAPPDQAKKMGQVAADHYLAKARETPEQAAQELAELMKSGELPTPTADKASVMGDAVDAGRKAAGTATDAFPALGDLGAPSAASLRALLRDGFVGAIGGIPVDLPIGVLGNLLSDWISGERRQDDPASCCCQPSDRDSGDGDADPDNADDAPKTPDLPPVTDPPVTIPSIGAATLPRAEWRFETGAFRDGRVVDAAAWSSLAKFARTNADVAVLLSASTDTVSSAVFNDALARRRGDSIVAQLQLAGIPRGRVFVSAHGEDPEALPVKTGDRAHEPRNRAVRVWVVKRAGVTG